MVKSRIHIQRWNCGTLRRYRFPNGTILVCNTGAPPRVLPAFCNHISAPCSRAAAAKALRDLRKTA